jgi:hypothetical protein
MSKIRRQRWSPGRRRQTETPTPYPAKDLSGTAGYQIADNATGLRLIFDTTIMNQKFLVGAPQGNEVVVALQ